MKRIFSLAVICALVLITAIALVPAPAAAGLITVEKGKTYLIRNGTHADSTKVDTTDWYRYDASESFIAVQYQSVAPSTTNPLDTFMVDYKWRGKVMTLARAMKLLADSTETVHLYQINYDSLGRPDFRFRHKSWRDSTDGYLQFYLP